MFLIDDFVVLIFRSIATHINATYLTSLENYLRKIRFLYERGEITENEYRRLETQVTDMIKNLKAEKNFPGSSEIRIL